MNLDLDPTQELLRDTVREFLRSEVPFDRIRALEREQRWDETLWKALCGQGWLGLPFAEQRGGGGGSLVDAGVLVEELARRAAIVPLVEAIACGVALEREAQVSRSEPQASEDQRAAAATDALVSGLLSGSVVPVPAVLEASDDFARISLELAGGRLRGEKFFVDYGQFATHHLVVARERSELALCLVDAGAGEVAAQPLRTIGRTPCAAVRYDGAPADRVAGPAAALALLQLGRAVAAVQCGGSAAQALDQTVPYPAGP